MEPQSLASLCSLAEIITQTSNWKTALDALIAALRSAIIFDNVAIFRSNSDEHISDVAYARALGRGKSGEADVAWGENIANQVLSVGRTVLQEPERSLDANRLNYPYLLGLPLKAPGQMTGALVFVRFGGPVYTQEHIQIATLAASLISVLFEREIWQAKIAECETMRQQMNLQEEFVATISHELRTPLGFIKGYTTTLLREDTEWDPVTQREFLTIIDEEADHLTDLIENILETARLQSDTLQMTFQAVNMERIIRDVAVRAQARYKGMRISLDLEPVLSIQGDAVRLAQVIENLLSNAAKYAPDSPVSIRLRSEQNRVLISVADQGPGIPPQHLPYIFDRFYRVPDEKTHPGTGLGLFICRQIVQMHHGQIWAESEPGHGVTFFITLPAD
ncbi:MAG: sensor histidine kinase [Candidatus Villigracilaceae bacterium]